MGWPAPGASLVAVAGATDVARVKIEDMKLSAARLQPYAEIVQAFARAGAARLEQWVIERMA